MNTWIVSGKELQERDVVWSKHLRSEQPCVVLLQHNKPVLVPLNAISDDDDERLSQALSKAAYRSIWFLDGQSFVKSSKKLSRVWNTEEFK